MISDKLAYPGYGHLRQSLEEDEESRLEWFELDPKDQSMAINFPLEGLPVFLEPTR